MKYLIAMLSLIALNSCSNSDLTLEEIADESVEFKKQKIFPANREFTVMIPKNWRWSNQDNGDENFLLTIDAGSPEDKDGFIDLITIQKVKGFSNSKNLKSEYKHLLELSKNNSEGMKLLESGETDILNYPAYYFHSKSDTETYGELEMISFILESNEDGVFYWLNAGASQTESLKKNMTILIQSLKTFKIWA